MKMTLEEIMAELNNYTEDEFILELEKIGFELEDIPNKEKV
ncbi:hypothetical protein [Halalkalibacter oceani]